MGQDESRPAGSSRCKEIAPNVFLFREHGDKPFICARDDTAFIAFCRVAHSIDHRSTFTAPAYRYAGTVPVFVSDSGSDSDDSSSDNSSDSDDDSDTDTDSDSTDMKAQTDADDAHVEVTIIDNSADGDSTLRNRTAHPLAEVASSTPWAASSEPAQPPRQPRPAKQMSTYYRIDDVSLWKSFEVYMRVRSVDANMIRDIRDGEISLSSDITTSLHRINKWHNRYADHLVNYHAALELFITSARRFAVDQAEAGNEDAVGIVHLATAVDACQRKIVTRSRRKHLKMQQQQQQQQ